MHECFTFQNFEVKADDLEQIEELGRGAYGVVEKMRHVPSGVIMAVKVGALAIRPGAPPIRAWKLHVVVRGLRSAQDVSAPRGFELRSTLWNRRGS